MAIALGDLPPSTITRGQFLTVSRVLNYGKFGIGLHFRDVECPDVYRAFHSRAFLKVTPSPDLIAEERKAGVPA